MLQISKPNTAKMNAHGLDVAVDNGDSPAAAPSNNTAYTTFRDAFNTQAFLVHPDTGALSLRPDKGKTSTALTTEKWQELVDTLRSWGPKDESGEYIPLNAIEDIEQRDASPDAHSSIGVVFDMKEAGGVRVCTEYGVLVTGQKRSDFWIPSDRYRVVAGINHEGSVAIECWYLIL
jgi:hypothetical protein